MHTMTQRFVLLAVAQALTFDSVVSEDGHDAVEFKGTLQRAP